MGLRVIVAVCHRLKCDGGCVPWAYNKVMVAVCHGDVYQYLLYNDRMEL